MVHTINEFSLVEQALAIKDGRIVAVGTSEDIIAEFAYDTLIDLRGKAVYPGWIDAHCHFFGLADNLRLIDLSGTTSFEEVLNIIDSVATNSDDVWVLGRGWDQNDWINKEFPDNSELNRLFPDRPVLLTRIDGHAAIANQTALDLAKITESTRITGGKALQEHSKLTGIPARQCSGKGIQNHPRSFSLLTD